MLDENACPKCAYDLRGAPGPDCPECGMALADMPAFWRIYLDHRFFSFIGMVHCLRYVTVLTAILYASFVVFEILPSKSVGFLDIGVRILLLAMMLSAAIALTAAIVPFFQRAVDGLPLMSKKVRLQALWVACFVLVALVVTKWGTSLVSQLLIYLFGVSIAVFPPIFLFIQLRRILRNHWPRDVNPWWDVAAMFFSWASYCIFHAPLVL